MAYTKHTWKERLGTKLNRFKDLITGEHLELVNDPEGVTQEGTPLRAEWLNEMEQGIEGAHTIGEAAQAAADDAQATADDALPRSDYTASDILDKLKSVDGSGSGLDADLLDGIQASEFVQKEGGTQRIGSGPTITNHEGGTAARMLYYRDRDTNALITFLGINHDDGDFIIGGTRPINISVALLYKQNRAIPTVAHGTGAVPASLPHNHIYIQY